ncbi:hypothetical protein F511_06134 [Dorcoceras hygrometricum]|uniref:Uncharacterized protein n=1 Tax=Dorcoceras hygrometricum TaxID=472368 RepID=A0A2Z7APP7_9LAMI|nr:hypothetical protein F511_06134 [Dorcoceras hygrometricum]
MSGRGRGRRGNPLEETNSDSNASIAQLLRLLVEKTGRGNGQSSSSRGPSHDDSQEKFRRQKPKEFSGTTDPLVAESWIKSMELAVGPQPLWLRNHNSGLAQRIMVKRLATSPHDPLGITDSACKNQSVVVSVQYGPFNPYIPIRSMTIGKSRVAIDPIVVLNRRNLRTGTHASYNKPDATIQSQLSSRNLSSRKLSSRNLSSRKLSSRNPRNAAFQLNETTSCCSLDWFLNSTAGHPVAVKFLPRLVLQFFDWSFSHERNDCQTQHKRND